jgi:hypothetical protein
MIILTRKKEGGGFDKKSTGGSGGNGGGKGPEFPKMDFNFSGGKSGLIYFLLAVVVMLSISKTFYDYRRG